MRRYKLAQGRPQLMQTLMKKVSNARRKQNFRLHGNLRQPCTHFLNRHDFIYLRRGANREERNIVTGMAGWSAKTN